MKGKHLVIPYWQPIGAHYLANSCSLTGMYTCIYMYTVTQHSIHKQQSIFIENELLGRPRP